MLYRNLRILALFAATAVPTVTLAATVIDFPNFSDCSTLQLNLAATCTGGLLRLTPATFGQAGSAFSSTTVPLGSGASFSTFFAFQMTSPGGASDDDGPGADGLTFTIQPVSSTSGSAGGGMGYQGIPSSVAVEFDTWNNGLPVDSDGNHIGIDLNGSIDSVARAPVATRMNNGAVWYAWVDYDGTTLAVRISQTNVRPAVPQLTYVVNLASVLGTTSAYVGFTAGTGAAFEEQDILQWQLNNTFAPIGGGPTGPIAVPAIGNGGLVVLAGLLALMAIVVVRRRSVGSMR